MLLAVGTRGVALVALRLLRLVALVRGVAALGLRLGFPGAGAALALVVCVVLGALTLALLTLAGFFLVEIAAGMLGMLALLCALRLGARLKRLERFSLLRTLRMSRARLALWVLVLFVPVLFASFGRLRIVAFFLVLKIRRF